MIDLLVAALATWRLSAMLSYERGPGDVFVRIRERLGIYHDDDGVKISTNGTVVAELVDCLWCLSPWMAVGVMGIVALGLTVVLYPFALSAAAIGMERWARG